MSLNKISPRVGILHLSFDFASLRSGQAPGDRCQMGVHPPAALTALRRRTRQKVLSQSESLAGPRKPSIYIPFKALSPPLDQTGLSIRLRAFRPGQSAFEDRIIAIGVIDGENIVHAALKVTPLRLFLHSASSQNSAGSGGDQVSALVISSSAAVLVVAFVSVPVAAPVAVFPLAAIFVSVPVAAPIAVVPLAAIFVPVPVAAQVPAALVCAAQVPLAVSIAVSHSSCFPA